MARRKRASMREGPLADLFRSTSDDAPADPPEAPRYGRQDPVERQHEDPSPAGPDVAGDASGSSPAGPGAAGDPPPPPVAKASSGAVAPTEPPAERTHAASRQSEQAETPPERLKRGCSEQPKPRHEDLSVNTPRYGREDPQYEPPGSGQPHQPVIRVVGVGGAGVNAVN